jgi:hypothetical protein
MPIDLTGGLDVARELVFDACPTTPGMRDAANMWIWDDAGEIGLPRVAIEATAPEWATHEVMVNVTLPGGRILRNWGSGPRHDCIGVGGKPTILGAGPIAIACIEPFRRYVTTYDGPITDTSFDAQARGQACGAEVDLAWEIECEMVVPPWIQGTMSREAKDMMSGTVEADFMGGDRYEQLFRARGTVTVDGRKRDFNGGGLRIRRQGVRNITGFWGHCWQSAVFPSGRAFGYIAYPPRPDGVKSYNEGYVFTGDGALIPAIAVEAPWLRSLLPSGEDVSLVLESDIGRTRIEGELIMAAPHFSDPAARETMPPLTQSIVRYRWDGEETYGMMERSNLPERVAPYR